MGRIINLAINNLDIWIENPRIEKSENENDAILKIYHKLKSKMVNLTEDISKNGLLNANNILVVEDSNKKGHYTVIEGNRRISAIKTILNPEILYGTPYYEKIKTLDKTIVNLIKNNIPCSVDTLDHQLKELEMIHNGENSGLGRINWGSYEKTKYFEIDNKILNSAEPGPLILYYIEKSKFKISQKNENIIHSIKVTNITRLLRYKTIKKYFNINKYTEITQNQFNELINFLIFFYNSGNKVDLIYKVSDASELLNNYISKKEEYVNDISDYNNENKIEEDKQHQDNSKINTHQDNSIISNTENLNVNIHNDNTFSDSPINNDNNNNNNNKGKNDNKPKYTTNPKPSNFFDNFKWSALNNQDTFENGIIILCEELKKLSKTGDYKSYPTATSIVIRTILESSLIYYAIKNKNSSTIFRNITKSQNRQYVKYKNLEDIIKEYLKQANNIKEDTSIFYNNEAFARYFKSFADSAGTKTYLDLIIHHPGNVIASAGVLENIANSGLKAILEIILN